MILRIKVSVAPKIILHATNGTYTGNSRFNESKNERNLVTGWEVIAQLQVRLSRGLD